MSKEKKAVLLGCITTISTLILGFGIMFLLWNYLKPNDALPGLFYYKAATFGDGICLPILLGSIITLKKYNESADRQSNKVCLGIGLAGIIIGVLIQMSWLIKDTTVLNWSIPIQNHFNVAGWYHSLFFIGMFGVIGYLFSSVWFILQQHGEEYSFYEMSLLILIVTTGSLFLLLFLGDDYRKYIPIPFLFSCAVFALFIILLLLAKSIGKIRKDKYIVVITVGLMSAYGVALLIFTQGNGDILLALCGSLCACFLWRTEEYSAIELIILDLWTMFSSFGIFYFASTLQSKGQILCIASVLLILSSFCESKGTWEIHSRYFASTAVCLYSIVSATSILTVEYDFLIELSFLVAIYLIVKKEITDYFSDVKKAEVEKNSGEINSQEFKSRKGKAYLQIVIAILAVTLLISHWLFDTAIVNDSRIEIGYIEIKPYAVGALFFLIGCLMVISKLNIKKYSLYRYEITVFVTVLYGILIQSLFENISKDFVPLQSVKLWVMFFSLFANVGAGIMTGRGFYRNMIIFRKNENKKGVFLLSFILLIGSASIGILTTMIVLIKTSGSAIGLSLAYIFLAFWVVPVLCAKSMTSKHPEMHVIPNSDVSGIAQDGMMIFLIVLFAAFMPSVYIGVNKVFDLDYHVATLADIYRSYAGILSLLVAAFIPVSFCLRQNVEHMCNQKRIIKQYPDEKEMWCALRKGLISQSLETVFAMLPYVIVIIIQKYGSYLFKSMTPLEAWQKLISTYIDGEYGKNEGMEEKCKMKTE